MLETPNIELQATPAESFEATGPLPERVHEFAQRWATFHNRALPACNISVNRIPPQHVGLGVGTQLGLSVAAALNAYERLPSVTPVELALSVGRGLRSAVGTYGFVYGGLIAERGKENFDAISPLDAHVPMPADWHFVLVRPRSQTATPGFTGTEEVNAFHALPPVPADTTSELIRLAREQLLPSALQADFPSFAAALDRYCLLAGMCFASLQGGPFNGPVLARLAEEMRRCGANAVGQSSWGPTIFSILPNLSSASEFEERLLASELGQEIEITLSAPNNTGANVHFA